jgi:hypothetical protein
MLIAGQLPPRQLDALIVTPILLRLHHPLLRLHRSLL